MSRLNQHNLKTLIECKVKIDELETKISELEQELSDLRKERKEEKVRLSDRRYSLELLVWGALLGFISGIFSSLILRLLGF